MKYYTSLPLTNTKLANSAPLPKSELNYKLLGLFYSNTLVIANKNEIIPSKLIWSTYKKLLADPYLKYFMYFNALEDFKKMM